jgi:hypothetical protein
MRGPSRRLTRFQRWSPPGGAIYLQSFSGAFSTTGLASKTASHPSTGIVTSAGAILRTPQLTKTGTATTSSSIARSIQSVYSGILTATGTLAQSISHLTAGVITSAGDATRQANKAIIGNIISSSILQFALSISQVINGVIDFQSSLQAQISVSLNGLNQFAGVVFKQLDHATSSSILFTSEIIKTRLLVFSAVLDFIVVRSKAYNAIFDNALHFIKSVPVRPKLKQASQVLRIKAIYTQILHIIGKSPPFHPEDL